MAWHTSNKKQNMKNFIIIALLTIISINANAQEQDLRMRAQQVKSQGSEAVEKFKAELQGMLKGNNEQTYLDVANAYYAIGEQGKMDEIQEIIKKKFPKGILVRNSSLNEGIYKINDAAECEKAYNKWTKDFPAKKLGNDIVYDYAAYSVALLYAEEGNEAKAMEYLHKMNDKIWVVTGYLSVGSACAKKYPAIAEKIYAEGVQKCDEIRESVDPRRRSELDGVYIAYGDILFAKGQKAEALALYEKALPRSRGINYGRLILEQGRTMQAFAMADARLRNGDMGEATFNLTRDAWKKANGNLDGCEEYIKSIKDKRIADKKAEVTKGAIAEAAPEFEIKDINGNNVKLSDYKGKIVILDFWATWCGPCKRSFPAMKKAVDLYKNDNEVQFLFIHTWERGSVEDAYKDAKAYLADNDYSDFKLLMDTKDPETRSNKAISAYKVNGIPAKFIIDKNGVIRFKVSGFSGSDEEAVAELQEMISQAKKMSK